MFVADMLLVREGQSMKLCAKLCLGSALIAAIFVAGGCAISQNVITIKNIRVAEYPVSLEIKNLTVVRFGPASEEEAKWARLVPAKIVSRLQETKRYKFSKSRQLRTAESCVPTEVVKDSEGARTIGRRAGADAVIYGYMTVNTYEPSNNRGRRYCRVELGVTMVEVASGRTIIVLTTSKGHELNVGESMDGAIERLIDGRVDDFVRQISDRRVEFTVEMEDGRDTIVKMGNKLAEDGKYTEALSCYETAIRMLPTDHGAIFNAGVMYEAMGDLKQARRMYDRSARVEPKKKYTDAFRRVSIELEN